MFVINFWCNLRLERGISVHILLYFIFYFIYFIPFRNTLLE